MNIIRLVAVALFTFTPVAISLAQEELPKQSASFFAFEMPPDRTTMHLLTGSEAFSEQSLPGANVTPAIQVLNQDGFICIYDKPVTGDDGVTKHPLLGKIKSSASWKKVMVILIGSKDGERERFSGFAFPASKADLPPGAIKFANLSPYPVRGMLGSTKLIFKPGTLETIKLTENSGTMIDVVFQYEQDDKWKRMMASQWAVSDKERILVFAFKNPITGNMTSKSVPLLED